MSGRRESLGDFQRGARPPPARSCSEPKGRAGAASARPQVLWEDPDARGQRQPRRATRQAPNAQQARTGASQAARQLSQRVAGLEARLRAAGASDEELDAEGVTLQTAFRSACVELITAHPVAAQKSEADRRLWQHWYRCLEGKPSLEDLGECSRFYGDLSAALESKLKVTNLLAETRQALQHSLQHTLVALGDIERYKQQKSPRLRVTSGEDYWANARGYYQRARAIAPTNGKVYNQLALVAARERKLLEAAYLYARSLGSEHPFPSRENLIQTLQKCASMARSTNVFVDSSSRSTSSWPIAIFDSLCGLTSGKVDASSWSAKLQSVISELRGLMSIQSLLIDSRYRQQIAASMMQLVCINLLLADGKQSTPNSGAQNTSSAVELLYTVGTSILLQLSELLALSSDHLQVMTVSNALLPALNMALLWLHTQSMQVKSVPADLFAESCSKFHYALPSSALAVYLLGLGSTRDRELPEDSETAGFVQLDLVRKIYLGSFPPTSSPPPRRNGKNWANKRENEESTSLSEKTLLELRMARTVNLCRKIVDVGGVKRFEPERRQAVAMERAKRTDHLCSQCSNSSSFGDGCCEFCGFEDETLDTSIDSDGDDVEVTSRHLRDMTVANTASERQSPPDPSTFAGVMAIGSQYSEFQSGFQPSQTRNKCLVVVDAPNVAMRHGMGLKFSSIGVRLAVDYFRALNHRVVAFIPDYMLQDEQEQQARRIQRTGVNTLSNNSSVSKHPDDVEMLRAMVQEGVLIPTPPQDYDDSYCIQYAGLHDGCVVTNDLFRDHVENMEGPRERKEAMRSWLKAHQISFTWVQNEFLPNPNFRFPS